MDTAQLEHFRQQLEAARTSLLALSASAQESRRPVTLDQQSVGRLSRMDALQAQAMQLETERRRRLDLSRIDAALKRVAEAEYGYCIACGDDIPLKRLQHDPAVPTCVDCAGN